ncbi:MAG: hypothetical protein ACKVW3_01805 [Phycisphaerales bacterium]
MRNVTVSAAQPTTKGDEPKMAVLVIAGYEEEGSARSAPGETWLEMLNERHDRDARAVVDVLIEHLPGGVASRVAGMMALRFAGSLGVSMEAKR